MSYKLKSTNQTINMKDTNLRGMSDIFLKGLRKTFLTYRNRQKNQ